MKKYCEGVLLALTLAFSAFAAYADVDLANLETISVADSSLTHVYDINNSGQYVGIYSSSATGVQGFIFDGAGYENVLYPGTSGGAHVWGINNDGALVGMYTTADGSATRPFVRSATGQYSTIDTPSASYASAYGINDFGDIVGVFSDGGPADGFLYRNGALTVLDFGNDFTQPSSINNSGLIVGNYGYQGFLYDPVSGERSFFTVNQNKTIARDINAAGDIVGSFFTADGGSQSYVRHLDGTFEIFSVPGKYETHAMGINDIGDMAGFTRGGGEQGFLALGAISQPIPEPASYATLLTGLGLVVVAARRRRR